MAEFPGISRKVTTGLAVLAVLMVAGSINSALIEKKKLDELTSLRQRQLAAIERQNVYLIQIRSILEHAVHPRRFPDLSPPPTTPLQ